MLTIPELEARRDILKTTLHSSEESLLDLKERSKIIKKEVANMKGAILELDRLIDGVEYATH
jgi:hypothetical protein